MTLQRTSMMVCDACGKKVRLEEVGEAGLWFTVAALVGTPEMYTQYEQMAETGRPGHDHGDFCGLICLINWASNVKNIRDLEQEVGE